MPAGGARCLAIITMSHKAEKTRHGRRNHHWSGREYQVKAFKTDFDSLARGAFPGPNFYARLQRLFSNVPNSTLQAWRRGLRPAPQWALDLIYDACAQTRSAANDAMEGAQTKKEAAQGGP